MTHEVALWRDGATAYKKFNDIAEQVPQVAHRNRLVRKT